MNDSFKKEKKRKKRKKRYSDLCLNSLPNVITIFKKKFYEPPY